MKERLEKIGSVAGVRDLKPADIDVYAVSGKVDLVTIGVQGEKRNVVRRNKITSLIALLKAAENQFVEWEIEGKEMEGS
jgi:hypothetical protein